MRTVFEGGSGEYEEKKSRFLAVIMPVKTEEEAQELIASVRKKHYDARHHCFAWILGQDGSRMRASDDGEPQGTAGRPILDILQGQQLTDVAAVVTRYFGGTLLGTGGLVRAYSEAVRDALGHCRILERKRGRRAEVILSYTDLGRLQYYLDQEGLQVLDSAYTDEVRLKMILPEDREEAFYRSLGELTGGRAQVEKGGIVSYREVDGKIEEE